MLLTGYRQTLSTRPTTLILASLPLRCCQTIHAAGVCAVLILHTARRSAPTSLGTLIDLTPGQNGLALSVLSGAPSTTRRACARAPTRSDGPCSRSTAPSAI